MATRVLITVDTELAWRHYARGAGWEENFALSCEPAGVGLTYQLAKLAEHGLAATFFVDPMPALVYGIEPVERMVAPILAAGQEVQLHLHSFWFDLAAGAEPARFELTAFDAGAQRQLIESARNLLVAAGAPPPTAFRSGSFAADEATLAALRDLGFSHDSSHNGADQPWPSALPFAPDLIDPVEHDGIVEIPVTQIGQREGGLRPFQLCALSSSEMEAALRHAAAGFHPVVTIVSHSFELATRDGARVNQVVRRRFDRLCAFLTAHRELMPTARFADLPREAANVSAPLPANPARTLRRLVEQGWSNARYERAATG